MIVLQAGLSLGLCVACAYWLPALYIGGALSVAIVSTILLMMNWGPASDEDEDQAALSWFATEFVYRLILGLTIGAIWPCLPIIFASKPKRDVHPSGTSD